AEIHGRPRGPDGPTRQSLQLIAKVLWEPTHFNVEDSNVIVEIIRPPLGRIFIEWLRPERHLNVVLERFPAISAVEQMPGRQDDDDVFINGRHKGRPDLGWD